MQCSFNLPNHYLMKTIEHHSIENTWHLAPAAAHSRYIFPHETPPLALCPLPLYQYELYIRSFVLRILFGETYWLYCCISILLLLTANLLGLVVFLYLCSVLRLLYVILWRRLCVSVLYAIKGFLTFLLIAAADTTRLRFVDISPKDRLCRRLRNCGWYCMQWRTNAAVSTWTRHTGCSVGWVSHDPPKILVGWATMHLAPPIIGLYVRQF